MSKPHIDSPCSILDDGSIKTTSQSKSQSTTTKKILAENRALQKYKAQLELMQEESRKQEQVNKSVHNKELLAKYAAKRAKVNTVKTKKKTHSVSKTSYPDDESVSTADDVYGNNEMWEVAPDPSKPCTEWDGGQLDGDDDEDIIKVLNHRKKTGGSPEMLTEWNNGETIWADVELAFQDAPLIVSKYIDENDLFDTAFEPKKMKRGKTDKSASKSQMEQMKCSHDGKTTAAEEECSHDDFRSEIGGYRPETDSRYFVPKFGMGNCFCALCKTKFVPAGATSKEQFRPSSLKPAFICANRLHGCFHSVCYDCFTTKSSEGTKSCRSTRNKN